MQVSNDDAPECSGHKRKTSKDAAEKGICGTQALGRTPSVVLRSFRVGENRRLWSIKSFSRGKSVWEVQRALIQ